MSIDPFPERVKARKLCQGNGTIHSTIPLGKLRRLSEYLHDDHGQAEVLLSFDRDESGFCSVRGTVSAQLSMQCQRCLEAVDVAVESTLDIRLADSEAEAGQLADAAVDPLDKLEIVVSEDGELDLLAVVEDELIMSLPIVASHDNARCNEALSRLQKEAGHETQAGQGNIKGLEVLEKLKQELQSEQGSGSEDRQEDE